MGTIVLWGLAIIGVLALVFWAYGWITSTDKGKQKVRKLLSKPKIKLKINLKELDKRINQETINLEGLIEVLQKKKLYRKLLWIKGKYKI